MRKFDQVIVRVYAETYTYPEDGWTVFPGSIQGRNHRIVYSDGKVYVSERIPYPFYPADQSARVIKTLLPIP